MKILFLDDDRGRTRQVQQRAIGHHLTAVERADEAIAVLKFDTFDIVSLDHDLGGQEMTESDENSGYAVAQFLAQMEAVRWPRIIIIHSFNPIGAEKMMTAIISGVDLRPDGWQRYPVVHRCPFGSAAFWNALGLDNE